MKKLLQTLAVFAVIVSPLAISPVASAAVECQVGYTGNDSKNICEKVVTYACEVENKTDVKFTNTSDQEAISGGSLSAENSTSGTATSGSAGNSNSTVLDFTIDNSQSACFVTYTSQPVTPSKPDTSTPVVPGRGEATPAAPVTPSRVAPVAAPQKAAPTMLPNTTGQTAPALIAATLATFGAIALLARLAVAAYSRVES